MAEISLDLALLYYGSGDSKVYMQHSVLLCVNITCTRYPFGIERHFTNEFYSTLARASFGLSDSPYPTRHSSILALFVDDQVMK